MNRTCESACPLFVSKKSGRWISFGAALELGAPVAGLLAAPGVCAFVVVTPNNVKNPSNTRAGLRILRPLMI
jgi:hypothetical protein